MAHDVFISFKNSDENGCQTKDSEIANNLYDFLTDKGLRVFFSNVELEFTGKAQYTRVIDDALDTSRFLIAVGSNHNNLNSQWVRYEWESFLNDIRSGIKPNAEVFVLISNMRINDLPRALRQQQAFDADDKNSYEKLYRFIKNARGIPVIEKTQPHSETQESKISEQLATPQKPIQSLIPPSSKQTNTLTNVKVGDVISFGKYEWRILDVQDDKVLIITKDCISLMKLECNPHPSYANFPYSGSNIRTYVDIEFRNSFSEEEKSRIIYPTTINEYGSTLYEHIFLLSIDEAKKYFKNDNDRIATYEHQSVFWLLRSNGKDSSHIAYVHSMPVSQITAKGGEINDYGMDIFGQTETFGVRPALWMKIDNSSTENITNFAPKTISLNELNVVHSPLNDKDYFQSNTKVMENTQMLQLGEWLYFSNPKDFKLYKIKVNGEGLSRVSKGVVHRKSIFDGYIYFVDEGRSNYIFRIDGNECKIFVDASIQFPFTLTPKGLVYSERGYASNPFMAAKPERYVLVDFSGNKVNEERFFVHDICSDENYVFFTKEEEGATLLYCADFDGTNVRKICDESCYIVGLNNGFIYIINKDDSNKLYKVYADGTQLTDLGFSESFNLVVIGEDVLYYNDMYSGIINRYGFKKGESELLLKIVGEAPFTNIFCVIGNWMFIQITLPHNDQSEYYLCRMSLSDGTFETIAKL